MNEYTEREQAQDRARAILIMNGVPQDGKLESYNQGKRLINRMRFPSRETYWYALAECRKWVGIP